jgi:uncharacterized protein (DUF1501 family)
MLNRRQLLQAGALGALGLSLPQLLRAESASRPQRIKSCIFILAHGGPAQLETFDPKPDAPAEIRGEFKPLRTNVPGIDVSEHLPRLAKLANHYSLIRSATHSYAIHNPGSYYVLTGRKPDQNIPFLFPKRSDWPALGAVLAKVRPTEERLPPYVLLPTTAKNFNLLVPGYHAGFLGAAYDPLIVEADPSKPNYAAPAVTPPPELTPDRLTARRHLLAQINAQAGAGGQAEGFDSYFERAFQLVSSAVAKHAFDIAQEPVATRERYGRNLHGQSVLLARRLVEAGVRLVLVNDAYGSGHPWDTHSDNFNELRKKLLPKMDNALASLIEDLRDRGLLESTLIVWTGEFGRTPKVSGQAGRDHWPHVYSLLMAGGGIRGGHVHGASDSIAAYPKDKPVSPNDIHATIYRALGLPPDIQLADTLTKRPFALYNGEPIESLF